MYIYTYNVASSCSMDHLIMASHTYTYTYKHTCTHAPEQ